MVKLDIRYLLLIIGSFVLAGILGGELYYKIFYMLLVLWLIAVVLAVVFVLSIRISMRTDDRQYFSGDRGDLIITIENKSILYIPYIIFNMPILTLFIKDYNGEVISIKAREELDIRCRLSFKTRGAYPLEEVIIWTRDPFGLINIKKRIALKEIIKVYPRRYTINEKLLTQEEAFQSLINDPKNLEDPYSSRDLRRYRVGDNLKRINWKVTAKKNELYIRNYEHITGDEFSIFLDMNKDNYYLDSQGITEELMVDFALSLGVYFLDKSIKTTIHMNKLYGRSFALNNERELIELSEYLIKEKSDGRNSLKDFVTDNIHKIKSKGAVALVTYECSEEILEALIALKEQGYRPSIFVAQKGEDEEGIKLTLKNLGIMIYYIKDVIMADNK